MENKNRIMAEKIAAAVERAGGRTYYVGGCVRDRLLGREVKDIDIEVHGIPVAALEGILDALGERMTVGKSFGVMGLRHYDLDIAMPRSEVATGLGHRDFAVSVNPFLGEEKAARRRDFTMNALMQDVLTGEILDFFGGWEDLEAGIIRHVDDSSFGEDPLRVFRGAQFAARFGFTLAEETRALSAAMHVESLAGERVMGELEKALLKAGRPSVFFAELGKMGQLAVWFPELQALVGVPQNAAYHPEGDAWAHTLQVLDEAALLRDRAREPLWFMLSALCHDFGKAVTTEEQNGVYHAYGHEAAGIPLTRAFLRRLTRENKLTAYALNMVKLHMRPNELARQSAKAKAYMKLFDTSLCPEDLLLLAKADSLGRLGPGLEREALLAEYGETEARLREMLEEYRDRMSRPYVMGRDLVEAGLSPGPLFTRALDYAHKLRLGGVPKEEQLRQTLEYCDRERQGEGVAAPAAQKGGNRPEAGDRLVRDGRFIALILRHKPETAGITLDEHGWADVEALIAGVRKTRPGFSRETLEEIVRDNNKQRFAFNPEHTKIRANQGHSVLVDVELPEREPPETLYHGTGERFVPSILERGLLPMSRLHVHLSADAATAVKVGSRHGRPVIFAVQAGRMYREGYRFWLSENGVWLTENVPPQYLRMEE